MSTVLITGGARGLGLDFVKQYAAKGWKIHACARTPDALKEVKGDIHTHKLEVTDYAAVKALAAELKGEAIDVLICNAGISGKEATVLGSIDPATWRETFEVNALAPLMMAEAFAGHVAASKDRKLVAISSRLGSITFANNGRYSYRASKAALNMLLATAAIELRRSQPHTVVVALHPGTVSTALSAPFRGGEIGRPAGLAAAQMLATVDGLTVADTGAFVAYDGQRLPW